MSHQHDDTCQWLTTYSIGKKNTALEPPRYSYKQPRCPPGGPAGWLAYTARHSLATMNSQSYFFFTWRGAAILE